MPHLILIIDDDPMIHRLISLMLAAYGYQVMSAASVAEGFNIIAQHRPDLVLCDVMMPDVDGLEFIRRCRQTPDLNTLPIISLSASGDSRLMEQTLKLGAFAFLPKPFSESQLAEMVALALQDRP